MTVVVVPLGRIREIIGAGRLERVLEPGVTAGDAYAALAAEFPALVELERSTRLVRNGAFAAPDVPLADGDELGLLPPFGGG